LFFSLASTRPLRAADELAVEPHLVEHIQLPGPPHERLRELLDTPVQFSSAR
jgi:hypothetical protein